MSKKEKISEEQADRIENAMDRVLNNPGVKEHLAKICVDALTTFAAEAKVMSADQFLFVPELALIVYMTALSHSATLSDAERAVVAACRSLPTAITSANLVSEKNVSTEDKLISKVTTASEMISRAAVSALPTVSKEDREAIKIGIQSNINFSCFIQRKGKKFYDPKAGLDAYNIAWLNPVEPKLSGSGVEDALNNISGNPMWGNDANLSTLYALTNSSFNSTPGTFGPVDYEQFQQLLNNSRVEQPPNISSSLEFGGPPNISSSLEFGGPPNISSSLEFGGPPNISSSEANISPDTSSKDSTFFTPRGKFTTVERMVEDTLIPAVRREQIKRTSSTGRFTPITIADVTDANGNIDFTRNPLALKTYLDIVSDPQSPYYYKTWAALRLPEGALPADMDIVYKLTLSTPVNSPERDDLTKAYFKLQELSLKTNIQNFDFKDPDVLGKLTKIIYGPIKKAVELEYKNQYPQLFKNHPEIIEQAVATVAEQYANNEGYSFIVNYGPPTNYWSKVIKEGTSMVVKILSAVSGDPLSATSFEDIITPILLPDSMSSANIGNMAKKAMNLALDRVKSSQPPPPPPVPPPVPPEAPKSVNKTPSEHKGEASPQSETKTPESKAPENVKKDEIKNIREVVMEGFQNISNKLDPPEKKWFGSYLWSFIKGIANVSLYILSFGEEGRKILRYTLEIGGIIFNVTLGYQLYKFRKAKFEEGSIPARLQGAVNSVVGGAEALRDKLTSNSEINDRIAKITKAVKKLAPAMAQDYIAYQNRMRAYQDQQMYRKALFDRQEEQRRYDIQRQNAIFMANERRSREEALLHNKQEVARQEADKKYLEELAQYHKKLEQVEKEFREKQRKYLELQGKRQNDEASRQLLRQSRKEYANAAASAAGLIADIAGMVLYPPSAITAAVGAVGNLGAPAAPGAPGAPGAQPGAFFNLDRLQNFADSADEYTRLAEDARQLGDFQLAHTYEQAADANLRHFHQIYDVSRSELKANEDRFYKGLTSFGRLGSDLVKGVSGLYFGYKDSTDAERLKNRELLIPPQKEYVGPPPSRAPYMANLRYVPEEVKDDDPRLVKYVKHEYIPEPIPADMYSTPRTYHMVNDVLPQMKKKKFSPGEGLSELPYVAPIPVVRVNPSSGARNTLRTHVTPVYHPNTQIHLKGVPQKKTRKH